VNSIPRAVVVLGLVSFLTDLSSEMIYPLLPLFLSSVLGATALELGVIEGVAEATASLLKVVSGVWTDRARKRKPLIVAGYSLSGFFRPLIALARTWHFVLFLRFVDRVGKGIRSSPRDALIADVTPPEQRGASYGFHRAMDHAGAVVGPLVASALLMIPGVTLRQVFGLAVVPAIITVAVLLIGVKEPAAKSVTERKAPHLIHDWQEMGRTFHLLLAALFVFTLGNSTDAFILVRLSNAGVSAKWIAALWSAHHVIKMVCTYYGGRFSDRHGRRAAMVSGWVYYGLIYLAFAFVESQAALIAVFLLYGVYFGLVEPSERALVADMAPERLRGTAFGYYHFTVGVGALPASLIFGVIWQRFGVQAAFITGAALALVASGMLFSLTGKKAG
jgi:MFS family permease